MTRAPSAHLLRTLAAVPPSCRVLDLGCGEGRHTGPLMALGFDVFACAPTAAEVEATRATLGDADRARRVTAAHPDALGFPDDYFDWVVAVGAYDAAESAAAVLDQLAETRRVLRPGGWVYVALRASVLGADAPPEALTALMEAAAFALAESPVREDDGGPVLRGIYRKVDATTTR